MTTDTRINARLQPQSEAEHIALLREALATAQDYLEFYCRCPAKQVVAKQVRRALEAKYERAEA